MDGCIEKRRDYTAGGGTYNENSCDLAGFANYVDAILAIKELCFERREISLKEYLDAVRSNWEGYDELLMKVRSCPHFGDNCEKSKETARRLHGDIVSALEKIETERGGKFFLNYYVYREYFRMAKEIRATPDGRRDGDYFAQGIGVARCHTKDSLTDVVQSAYCFDAESYGTSSLDLQLPYGKTSPEHIVMLLKTLAHIGVKHIQINCVSPEELIKAQKNPENYQDLIVRVTGFSAKFVALSEEFQNELISRTEFSI
jgi:formate C-acetyltransferase